MIACRCCHLLAGMVGVGVCGECAELLERHSRAREAFEREQDEIQRAHEAVHAARAVRSGFEIEMPPDDEPIGDVLARLAEARYEPSAAEREIAARHPEVSWLVHLSPQDRRFYSADRARLRLLIAAYPGIEDQSWLTLLRPSMQTRAPLGSKLS